MGRRGRCFADERFHIGPVVVGVVPVARRTRLERCRLERVRRPGGWRQLVRLLVIVGAALRVPYSVFCHRLWPLVLGLLLRLMLLRLMLLRLALLARRTQRHLHYGRLAGDHYATAVFMHRQLATGCQETGQRRRRGRVDRFGGRSRHHRRRCCGSRLCDSGELATLLLGRRARRRGSHCEHTTLRV